MQVNPLYINGFGFLALYYMFEILILDPSIANALFDSCVYVAFFSLQSHPPGVCIKCLYDFFIVFFVTSIVIPSSLSV